MIDLRQQDGVFVLQMDDAENRFNRESVAIWHARLDEVEKGDGPAALVTVGSGKFYSSGLDLDWLVNRAGDAVQPFFRELYRLFARILSFPAITVAALNGHAFGAGALIAVAHDYAVMRLDRGFFCMPELDLKLPLAPEMTALLAARLPKKTAHEVIVTGRRWGGAEAQAAGIVDHAVPEEQLLARAIEIARPFAQKDRKTMAALKRDLYRDTLQILGNA